MKKLTPIAQKSCFVLVQQRSLSRENYDYRQFIVTSHDNERIMEMEMEKASNKLIIVAFGGRTMAIELVKAFM
uniref:Uncharacterized protein n=1 Tax=Salix viminalis TaxID=40686 RepID=A0A6N2M2F8_SALVM